MNKYITINDKKIQVMIREYQYSKNINMYFVGDVLKISKPLFISDNEILKLIKKNEKQIYDEYIKIISLNSTYIKHWFTGEKILYNGEEYTVIVRNISESKVKIVINHQNKEIEIMLFKEIDEMNENERKDVIDKVVKKVFMNNTKVLINDRLKYWSEVTNIQYMSYKITNSNTRYGSCKPLTKELFFSSKLIMLPVDKIDAIIVHELCHIIYQKHNKQFYDLVKKYIINYEVIDKWLKVNSKLINI